jgi:hypothetical protein
LKALDYDICSFIRVGLSSTYPKFGGICDIFIISPVAGNFILLTKTYRFGYKHKLAVPILLFQQILAGSTLTESNPIAHQITFLDSATIDNRFRFSLRLFVSSQLDEA